MHNCADKHKEVPNGMRIFFAFPDIKEDTIVFKVRLDEKSAARLKKMLISRGEI